MPNLLFANLAQVPALLSENLTKTAKAIEEAALPEKATESAASFSTLAMQFIQLPVLWLVVATMLGLWLMLPRGENRGRRLGMLFGLIALGLAAYLTPRLTDWLDMSLFGALAATTVVSCTAAITSRDSLYSALWFGLALLATGGLFLFNGSQFLSVATITVYAGAILVTVLFVIMLAKPEGYAYYDRLSWEAFLSAAAGAILVGLLTATLGHALYNTNGGPPKVGPADAAQTFAETITVQDREAGILSEQHVANFGRVMIENHLISMQAAGVLMLAALVGAVAIVGVGKRLSEEEKESARLSNNKSTATGGP